MKICVPGRVIYFLCLIALLATEAMGQPSLNTTLIGRWAEGPCNATAAVGNIVYFGNGGYLEIADFTDPVHPIELAKIVTPSYIRDVVVSGGIAYVATDRAGLRMIDVSNPLKPMELGVFDTFGYFRGVTVSGNYAYLARDGNGMQVIDVSNPAKPVEVGFFYSENAIDVVVSGQHAYVAAGRAGLRVIDISDPANPLEVGLVDTQDDVYGVAVSGNYAYVTTIGVGLRVIDVSDPANPAEVSFFDIGSWALRVTVREGFAYVAATNAGLRVIDVSAPANPIEAGFFDTEGFTSDVTISGNYAYVADAYAGLRVIDVSTPATVVEAGFFETGGYAHHIAVSEGFAYVADEISGFRVIDVSDSGKPLEVGFLKIGDHHTADYNNGMAVSGGYVYVASNSGLRVIDVSSPPNPVEVGHIDTDGQTLGVAVNDSYAYIAAGDAGLRVIDVSSPANPQEVGSLNTGDQFYEVAVSRGYAYVAAINAGLRVIDVSIPTNPIEVGSFETNNPVYAVAVSGSYAYIAEYDNGLWVIDVSIPAQPVEVGFFQDFRISWPDVAVRNTYVYIANRSAGLRVIDVSDPVTPVEAGFFDTGGDAHGVTVRGYNAYVADGADGVYIIRNDLIAHIPAVTNIVDIPNDQGKQVRVSWMKSSLDGAEGGDSPIVEYSLWRRIDESPASKMTAVDEHLKSVSDSLPPGEWDFILTVPAIGDETYHVVAPTLGDSNQVHGMHWSYFTVIAHTADPLRFFVSQPDSGYSLDNLVPHTPEGVLASLSGEDLRLTWQMVPDEDFNYYAVYRSNESGFDPASQEPYVTTVDTFFHDSEVDAGKQYFYRVSAFDFSGNESGYSAEVTAIVSGIASGLAVPGTFKLYQNLPNPFNPGTVIPYDLPKSSLVVLKIYNILGQEVRTLVNERQTAGRKSIAWDGRDRSGKEISSGVYIYKIQAGDYLKSRKMLLLR